MLPAIPPMPLLGPRIRLETEQNDFIIKKTRFNFHKKYSQYSEANLGSVAGLEYQPVLAVLMSP